MEGTRGYQSQKCKGYGPPGRQVCWNYYRQVSSTNQGEFEQTRKRADHLTQEVVTYGGANLTAFQEILHKISPAVQVRQIIQTMYSAYQNTTNPTKECWICLLIEEKGLLGVPVPHNWNHTSGPVYRNQTATLGPVATTVFLDTRGINITCLVANKTSPRENEVGSLNPHICSDQRSIPNNSSLCTEPGIFLLCGRAAYKCLPRNWTGICLEIFLTPSISIWTPQEMVSLLQPEQKGPTRTKRRAGAAKAIGAGLFVGVGTEAGGLGLSASTYYKLSAQLNDDMDKVADSLTTLQQQKNSPAEVTLQNRWALDLITTKKGGTCMLLGEECCYFVNQSGIVTKKVKELKENIKRRAQELESWNLGLNPQTWLKWVLPFLGPLLIILLGISLGPCILRTLVQNLEATVTRRASAKVLALENYQHQHQKLQQTTDAQDYSQLYDDAKGAQTAF